MNDIITAAMAEEVVKNFSGRRILIVGDMVADIYLTGNISRISREAPVLVLEQADEKIVAGGAANVANNVATLGAAAYMIGITGDDRHGEKLKGILSDGGVNTEGIINDKERPTITKTRIIAGGRATVSQQIVRIDNEAKTSLSSKIETKLINLVKQILPRMEAVVLSDYGSGTITPALRDYILTYCRASLRRG